jgi:hypothetical protein
MSRDGNVIKKRIVYFTGSDITFKDTALIQLSKSFVYFSLQSPHIWNRIAV